MALMQFRDRQGVTWQVWAISGERAHGSTRAEVRPRALLDGWLVFESEDGGEKRRHCPIPDGWTEASVAELERLCETAEVVRGPGSRMAGQAVASQASVRPSASTRTEHEVSREKVSSRSFLYPGGRVWTAAEMPVDGAPARARRSVLRFTAGRRTLDLEDYPDEWAQQSDADLADLLYRGFPRTRSMDESSTHRRRRDDAPGEGDARRGTAAED